MKVMLKFSGSGLNPLYFFFDQIDFGKGHLIEWNLNVPNFDDGDSNGEYLFVNFNLIVIFDELKEFSNIIKDIVKWLR